MPDINLIACSLSLGAKAAALLNADALIYDRSYRAACEANVCGKYQTCWACPPDVGDIDELIRYAKRYQNALAVQTVSTLDDCFDIYHMELAAKELNKLLRNIRTKSAPVLERACLLGAGGCHHCTPCYKCLGADCPYPSEMVAPVEAYGLDVYALSKACGLPCHHGENTVTFFGVILF